MRLCYIYVSIDVHIYLVNKYIVLLLIRTFPFSREVTRVTMCWEEGQEELSNRFLLPKQLILYNSELTCSR